MTNRTFTAHKLFQARPSGLDPMPFYWEVRDCDGIGVFQCDTAKEAADYIDAMEDCDCDDY